MDLLKYTVNKEQTSEKLILLEGLCNSQKLVNEDDQLEMRYMDELQAIEANIGDIAGCLGLQFEFVPEKLPEDKQQFEVFDDNEKNQRPKSGGGEEGEEKKDKVYSKTDYTWTKTNRHQ